ncbi:aminotransferase-like domain-containing protein [Breznakia pachnodae]|uniref:DNA-binding transcriptional MocR family regulator n=1 Tax=Breznakia pachnodae TaxID=265178 RepID=A0ABU0E5G2_9FIRM|nr:PLP-dependent aminotransferase family protein [Breznakia pachnodae]MDQ0361954.1 DNA-binding transcriptional MocR family regulator [Breznakia pachnodae]
MPINSFDDYPMSWIPNKSKLKKPIYLSIANELITDIEEGVLEANTKLPPQRELADYLDLNLSTITKAFKYCELNGYIYGITGKGTFVSQNRVEKNDMFLSANEKITNLGLVEPYYEYDHYSLKVAQEVLRQPNALTLFTYDSPIGTKSQIASAKRWLKELNVEVSEDQIAIFPGVQNTLTILLIAMFHPGDRIAVDKYTYTNFVKLANQLNLRLVPIEGDQEGMLPKVLKQECSNKEIKGIFLMPTLSNPTNTIMGVARKKELSKIIKEYELLLIEDETYNFLLDEPVTPLISIIPEQTIYVHGVSKEFSAGLRVAFVVVPEILRECILDTAINVNLKGNALSAEIVSRLIDTKVAKTMVRKKRRKAKRYTEIFKRQFPSHTPNIRFFQWIQLPDSINAKEFEEKATQHEVRILGSHQFVVGEQVKQSYIRIALSSVKSEKELETSLVKLKALIESYQ